MTGGGGRDCRRWLEAGLWLLWHMQSQGRVANMLEEKMFCGIKARCGHTYSTASLDTELSTVPV